MTRDDQRRWAEAFRARHHARPLLLLPNAWDGMSARLFAAAGFDALATTSAGVAWALGYPDGERAPWTEVVAATARIVRAAGVPVTADIEEGYGEGPAQVAERVADIIAAGAVGLNLEDGRVRGGPPLRDIADMARRIAAARAAGAAAGVPVVINARVDVYLKNVGEESGRFEETVRRAEAYIAAGADCVYPMGLRDPATIAAFVKAVAAPVNVTGRPGMPDAAALERLGVARVTIASAPTLVAMSATQTLAERLRATGSFEGLAAPLRHADAQRLFAGA